MMYIFRGDNFLNDRIFKVLGHHFAGLDRYDTALAHM